MAILSTHVERLKSLSRSILSVLLPTTISVYSSRLLAQSVACNVAIVLLPAVPVMLSASFLRLNVLTVAEQRQHHAYSSAATLTSEACKQNRTVAAYGQSSCV
jgi:ABC transporter transmembrane region